MSSDPIEVLRESAKELRALLAEMDPPRKPATGGRKMDADQLRHTLGNLESALASLSAPKPESAEPVVCCQMDWTPRGLHKREWTCRHCGQKARRNSADGHPHVPCTSPPRPEASDPIRLRVIFPNGLVQFAPSDTRPGYFEGLGCTVLPIHSEDHLAAELKANERRLAAPQQASAPVGVEEAFEEYHKADHRDPAVAQEWEWWQAAWKASLAQQPAACDGTCHRSPSGLCETHEAEAHAYLAVQQKGGPQE